MNYISSSSFTDTKSHYEILDGLRGVAAVIVVMFHILETFTGGDHSKQIINHGYMAVDFFFVLSGFVIGYAYDDRWNKMSLKGFFKRRIIRLHPNDYSRYDYWCHIFLFPGRCRFSYNKSDSRLENDSCYAYWLYTDSCSNINGYTWLGRNAST